MSANLVDLYDQIYKDLDEMSYDRLTFVWRSLQKKILPREYAPGIPMQEWLDAVYSELEKREFLRLGKEKLRES
jgi:hypothetical protein